WKSLAEGEGLVLAAPDSADPRGWGVPQDGPDFIRDLVEELKRRHAVDPRRVYLFGYSAGAVFALSLSMMESEYFAASAVYAGAWRGPNDSAVMRYARRKTPLAIYVGDRDELFPPDSVRATEAALKGQGFDARVTLLKDRTHRYADAAEEVNRGAWEFLKRQRLAADPAYKTYSIPSAVR
ncbi:MAG TPA: dienelactone hydrolase family protein, partial [Pyrinomonadaceae bacterium]